MRTAIMWLAMLILPSAPALAGPPPEVMKQALRQAGLSAEQITQIDKIIFEAEKAKLELRHQLEKARLEMGQLLGAEKPDRRAVLELADKMGRLESELRKNHLKLLLDVRALMTSEQWTQIEAQHFRWKKKQQAADLPEEPER